MEIGADTGTKIPPPSQPVTIEPFQIAKRQLAIFQPFYHPVIGCKTDDRRIRLPNQRKANLPFFIPFLYKRVVRKRNPGTLRNKGISPILFLHKGKPLPQQGIHGLTKGNLMGSEGIGYKNHFHRYTPSSLSRKLDIMRNDATKIYKPIPLAYKEASAAPDAMSPINPAKAKEVKRVVHLLLACKQILI